MIITQRIPIIQSKRLSRKIAGYVKECDTIYDMSILMKQAHPHVSDYDLINMMPDWRARFGLTGAYFMHEAAAKQARRAVIRFWDANRAKHDRRVIQKNQVKAGKRTKYRPNRWTDPDSLLRRQNSRELLRSLSSRGTPKMRDRSTITLPGLGAVRLKEGIPEGEMRSFQMVDVTKKVTCRTTDADRQFALHLQLKVPDPEPASGKGAGMDLGVRHLTAVVDEDGNESLHNVSGGCKRYDGDRIDKSRSEQSRHRRGSGRWNKLGCKIRTELKKISNRQRHEEIRVARQVVSGRSVICMEGWNLAWARASNGHTGKTGLNRSMAYSRMGAFRDQVKWQMKKIGGTTKLVDRKNTSTTCARCRKADKRSRNGEDFRCTFCGWRHHADKNAAKNILTKHVPHEGTGGQPHDHGGAIAGTGVVTRREDRGPGRPETDAQAGRLGPGSDGNHGSDRAPERALGVVGLPDCRNFCF